MVRYPVSVGSTKCRSPITSVEIAICKHYWPDSTPNARLARANFEHAGAQGHEATVLMFTPQPAYNEIQSLQPS